MAEVTIGDTNQRWPRPPEETLFGGPFESKSTRADLLRMSALSHLRTKQTKIKPATRAARTESN